MKEKEHLQVRVNVRTVVVESEIDARRLKFELARLGIRSTIQKVFYREGRKTRYEEMR